MQLSSNANVRPGLLLILTGCSRPAMKLVSVVRFENNDAKVFFLAIQSIRCGNLLESPHPKAGKTELLIEISKDKGCKL